MNEILLRKGLVCGITALFIGAGVLPSVSSDKPVFGNTIYVDDDNIDGPWDGTQEHPYRYIQDGVDNAGDGDKIFVFSGIYNENVVVDTTINLTGEDRNNTIIDGGGNGDVVLLTADYVYLSGFTIRSMQGFDYELSDSGIDIRSNYSTINGNYITNNVNGVSVGYWTYNKACSGNIIVNNTIINNWEGINIIDSLYNTICGNIISNSSGHGIGCVCSIENNISNNIIKNQYTGIEFQYLSKNNTVFNNKIHENSNGIYIISSLENCILSNIISENDNGIIIYYSSNNSIRKNNISNNNMNGILFPEEEFDSDYNTDNNRITNNVILMNNVGIFLSNTTFKNHLYYNNLCKNNNNAKDYGDNIWYSLYDKKGNFWDDYEEKYPEAHRRLFRPWIWNEPYDIPGENNTDRFPLSIQYSDDNIIFILSDLIQRIFNFNWLATEDSYELGG